MTDQDKEPTSFGSFQFLHDRAVELLNKRSFGDAEACCRKAVQMEPEDAGIRNLWGQALLSLLRPDEAAQQFALAIQIDGQLPNLHYNLALAYQAKGRIIEAIDSVTRAIELDRNVPVLHAKLGQLLSMAGMTIESVPVLRRALLLDPKSVNVRLNLAQALADIGESAEAERLVREAMFLNPEDPFAHRMLGRIQQLNGQFEEAVISFEKSILRRPVQADAYFSITYSKRISGSDHDLVRKMETLVNDPRLTVRERGHLNYALGKANDDQGEFGKAFPYFHQANEIALQHMEEHGRRFDSTIEDSKVDRVTEVLSSECLSQISDRKSVIDRPIFIVGMIRSGTTLVEQILSRHPEVIAAGELGFWIENTPRMIQEISESPESSTLAPSWRLDYDAVLDRISPTASRITDKMPLNYWAVGLIHLAYPNAKIIHCRRDPRDTGLSIYVTPYRRSPDFGHSLQNIAVAYCGYQRLMNHWRRVLPFNSLLDIDYEILVSNPAGEIRKLIDFVDLDWDEDCLNPDLGKGTVNSPSQWQVRQPFYQHSIGRWQNYSEHLGPLLDL